MDKEEIIQIRKKLCVSQEKFAQLLGATVVTVNRWENGKAKPSRLYVREIKELEADSESYLARRQEGEGFQSLHFIPNSLL